MKDMNRWAYIACIDRAFTAEEWDEWCRSHNTSQIIFKFKDFGYNECDVCLTPHITKIYEGKSRRTWEIHTAQSPNGRWTEGNTIGLGGSPVTFCTDVKRGYATEREAIFAGLLRVEACVKSRIEWCKHAISVDKINGYTASEDRGELKELRAVLEAIAICKDRHDPRQLTLF